MSSKKFKHYWICHECATEMGGTWPEGHVATVIEDECRYCDGKKQIEKTIAPYVDYDWDQIETKHLRD